ncbi:MAG: hypothetical protein P4L46_10260 [Fimbriimonas sp.]|nr:hypothetical protein [Fimbriimonas sp.]
MARKVAAHKSEALSDLWKRIIHVVFVFDRNAPLKSLSAQFIENSWDIGDSQTVWDVMAVGGELVQVL